MAKKQYIYPDGEDPYRFVMRTFMSKWKPLILTAIQFDHGATRYSQFIRGLPISDKVLAENLRELVEDGLIERVVYTEVPVRVEYHLTEVGQSTIPLLFSLYEWGWTEMKRRGLAIDVRGQMFHGYLEPDPEIMWMPMNQYLEWLERKKGGQDPDSDGK